MTVSSLNILHVIGEKAPAELCEVGAVKLIVDQDEYINVSKAILCTAMGRLGSILRYTFQISEMKFLGRQVKITITSSESRSFA